MTRAEFYKQFPEFATLENSTPGQDLLTAMLAGALLELSSDRWGALLDQGQGYLTAHKLATSAWGNAVKMSPGDGTSPYLKEFQRLAQLVGGGGLLL